MKTQKIIVIVVVLGFTLLSVQNLYLCLELKKNKELTELALYNANEAKNNASEATNFAEQAARYAEEASSYSFGSYCGTCP